MKKQHVVIFLALLLCALPFSSSASQEKDGDPPYVTSARLADRQVLQGKKPVVVTFSRPMVANRTVGSVLPPARMPFAVSPAVEGDGMWISQTSFAFAPRKGFRRGVRYFLQIKKDLRALDGKKVEPSFSFRTAEAKVSSLEVEQFDAEKNVLRCSLTFNSRVDPRALASHLRVTDAASGETLPVTLRHGSGESEVHSLSVALGAYRPKVQLVLLADEDADGHYLGLLSDYKGTLALPKPGNSGGEEVAVRSGEPSPVRFTYVYNGESAGLPYIRHTLSDSLNGGNAKDFIAIDPPELRYSLGDGSEIEIAEGLRPGMRVSVTLKAGLVDSAGRVLAEDRTHTTVVKDYSPTARFSHRGNYLTPVYGSRLGLDIVNVDQVTVYLKRQYDNNLPFMNLDPDYRAKDLMRNIVVKEFPIRDAQKNEVLRRGLDLNDLANGRRGIFLLSLDSFTQKNRDDGSTYMDQESSGEQLVILSDIGITARAYPSGISVFASSLASAKPLAGARVSVYSASNQVVAEGETDENGLFLHRRKEAWDPQLLPNVVTVRHGDPNGPDNADNADADISFLPLEQVTAREMPDPASRDYLDKGYEAFLYTPRGVFRPGETVDIKAFVRDAKHMPPASFPVLFRLLSSRGLEMARASAALSPEGGADFSFTLPKTAPTGDYQAFLEIPGQKDSRMGFCTFNVEDFVPPRLEVGVTPQKDILLPKEPLPVALSGQYLFGAPGAGLAYELGYKAGPVAFTPEGFEGYSFGDRERVFDVQVALKHLTGKLGKDGTAEAAFKAPEGWLPPAAAHLLLIASVQEDGGRWVTKTHEMRYFPTPYLLGLKSESENLSPGKPVAMRVVAVTPDGRQAPAGELKAEISLIKGNWHTVYRNRRYVSLWDERFLIRRTLSVDAASGAAGFSFTPDEYGSYLVRVATKDGAVVASRRVFVSGGDGAPEGSGRLDSVELSFDKPAYRAGDTARLSVKAPYAGTLVLGVERGEALASRVIAMDKPATVVDIPVPVIETMDASATVTAWVIRPVREENKEWYAHRANGMITLPLSKDPHTLKVAAQSPKRILPGKPVTIAFSVTDETGAPVQGEFSAAFIDEGILSLTAFTTPKPLDFFLASRRAVGKSYDAFDALLRPEARATPLLAPGGDAAAAYQGSLSTQQIFLTAYVPTVRTDESGRGEVRFDIPEYSGKGRLMLVGASRNRFASSEAEIRVARDLVVESAAPRAVAPGDSFELSLNLFTLPGEDASLPQGKATVRVTAEGPLSLSGDVDLSLPLAQPTDAKGAPHKAAKHSLLVRATALREVGVARVSVGVAVPGREDLSFTKTMEVAVRAPYPRTSAVKTTMLRGKGKSATLAFTETWVKGSVRAVFSIDKSPVLAVLPALEYLREYPYGCLEQLTSRAWPYLTLASVQKALHPEQDQAAYEKSVLADVVARIASMQTPESGFGLWPGDASPDPWKSVNATFFLVEAKAGTPVPGSTLDRALGYLRLLLAMPVRKDMERYDYSTKAYAAFVLTRAGDAPLSWIQHLSEHENEMYPSGRIFLAGAKALKAGNPDALKALGAGGPLASPAYTESMETDLRNTSLLLLMWSLVAPGDPESARLCLRVAELLSKDSSHTPQNAGMAALALGRYLERTEKPSTTPYAARIQSGGATLATITDGKRLLLNGAALPLNAKGQPPALSVTMDNDAESYSVYSVRGVPMSAPQPVADGIAVRRVWKDADGKTLDLSSGTVKVKKGERIIVELTVKPHSALSHVALSDLLPGGMEVENPRLKTAAGATNDESEQSGLYLDLREDRLLLFFTRLAREQTYSYSLRAVSRGTFVLPPLAADAMYAPDVRAVTGTGVVVVE